MVNVPAGTLILRQGTGEIPWQSRVLAALSRDQSSIESVYVRELIPTMTPASRDPMT